MKEDEGTKTSLKEKGARALRAIFKRSPSGSSKREERVGKFDKTKTRPADGTTKFNYFTLIPFPTNVEGMTAERFNSQIAEWIAGELKNKQDLSALELYLTREGMTSLRADGFKIDDNYNDLIGQIAERLPKTRNGDKATSPVVAYSHSSLPISPASPLRRVFDQRFLARHIEPPQVYVPPDDSKIPSSVDQYLIGSLEVQGRVRGKEGGGEWSKIGETPIRALLSAGGGRDGRLPVQTHVDFDILLKAFPDEPFCGYLSGVNIEGRLTIDGIRRLVKEVDLDIHDTKALAGISQVDEDLGLFYDMIETGSNNLRNVLEIEKDIYEVEILSEDELKRRGIKTVDTMYEIAPGYRVPVAGKVGMRCVLKFDNRGKKDVDIYNFIFRFFRHALPFTTRTSKLTSTGQLVRGSGNTVVMLPPMSQAGVEEVQTPAFVISPVAGGGKLFNVSAHSDSVLRVFMGDERLSTVPKQVDLGSRVELKGELDIGENIKEEFRFTLLSADEFSEERKQVAGKRSDLGYTAFVEVGSDRTLSLARKELILGRRRFLDENANVSPKALTLERKYVTWIMSGGKGDSVLYYSTRRGVVTQPLTELGSKVTLGVLGTYYVYVGDFEFMISLEATPRTGLLFDEM